MATGAAYAYPDPHLRSEDPAVAARWTEPFAFELSDVEVEIFSGGRTETIPGQHLLIRKLPNAFVTRYGTVPEKIYVRDSYKTLYETAAQSRISSSVGYSVTLFTGVPGIGKSLFLVYFIYRFLTDERFTDKRFVLEFTSGTYICFQPNGVPGEFWCSMEVGSRMQSKEFLLLCDIIDPVHPASRAQWTFIFSSPAPARYKEFLKHSPSWEFTMPTWSELELMFVSAEKGNWYDRFVLFGGVPRYIFPAIGGRDPHILMCNALEEKGGALAESFFKYGFGFGLADSEQSYMLVHINPPRTVGGEFDYSGKKVYTFASDAIFQSLSEKYRQQTDDGYSRGHLQCRRSL